MPNSFSEGMDVHEGEAHKTGARHNESEVVLVDAVIGFVTINKISRVTFGQLKYQAGDAEPAWEPVITLAMSQNVMAEVASQLTEIASRARGFEND